MSWSHQLSQKKPRGLDVATFGAIKGLQLWIKPRGRGCHPQATTVLGFNQAGIASWWLSRAPERPTWLTWELKLKPS